MKNFTKKFGREEQNPGGGLQHPPLAANVNWNSLAVRGLMCHFIISHVLLHVLLRYSQFLKKTSSSKFFIPISYVRYIYVCKYVNECIRNITSHVVSKSTNFNICLDFKLHAVVVCIDRGVNIYYYSCFSDQAQVCGAVPAQKSSVGNMELPRGYERHSESDISTSLDLNEVHRESSLLVHREGVWRKTIPLLPLNQLPATSSRKARMGCYPNKWCQEV